MRRQIVGLLCHLVCVSALAAEPVQSGRLVLGPDDPVYVVAHAAVDCPICKAWRASDSGLPLAKKFADTWPHVHFVLIDRPSVNGSEHESLYPSELRYLYRDRRERYQLSPPTPLFEIVVHDRVVLRLAGLHAWTEQVVPAVRDLERVREPPSSAEVQRRPPAAAARGDHRTE
jgi:hypothetical protein